MIEIRGLVKRFGPLPVLSELDLDIKEGEFAALLGPNGAGKTTLLRILATLSRPTAGDVRVANLKLPAQASALRSQLGVVSHQTLLYGDLTASENLAFFGRLYGIPAGRQLRVLELVGLEKRRYDLVRTYSRGMQQRLAIARAILHSPRILLLDEPHTGLDQEAGEILDRVLREVALEGRTVVMTSHDLVRAADLADRLLVLTRGKIAASITKDRFQGGDLAGLYRQALAESGGAS